MPSPFLDEKKKQLAEGVIKGRPKQEMANELGVHRTTLYEWMRDPAWQEYYTRLVNELEHARAARLMPTFMKTVDLFDAALERAMEQLLSGSPESVAEVPTLPALAEVLKKVHGLERTDAGKPTEGGKGAKNSDTPRVPAATTRLEKLLGDMMGEDGTVDPSETVTAGSKSDEKLQ